MVFAQRRTQTTQSKKRGRRFTFEERSRGRKKGGKAIQNKIALKNMSKAQSGNQNSQKHNLGVRKSDDPTEYMRRYKKMLQNKNR